MPKFSKGGVGLCIRKSWYGELKGDIPDLVSLGSVGSKTNFRGFFGPVTFRISSFQIYWIRLIWNSLFLSSNLTDFRLKIVHWVPQIGVPPHRVLRPWWIPIELDLISVARHDLHDWDWRTIRDHFCVTQAFWPWGFLENYTISNQTHPKHWY